MPTSATGNDRLAARGMTWFRAGRRGGFTYIELLVAVFLIGLLVSLALLALPGETPSERLQREAERLYARMDLAREEAVLQTITLGLGVDDAGYRFLRLRSDRWQALADDRLLPEHELPADVELSLDLDGIEVSLEPPEESGEAEGGPSPQLYFLATGEILPDFTLRLRADDTDAEFVIEPGDEEWLTLVEHEE